MGVRINRGGEEILQQFGFLLYPFLHHGSQVEVLPAHPVDPPPALLPLLSGVLGLEGVHQLVVVGQILHVPGGKAKAVVQWYRRTCLRGSILYV